MTIVGFVCATLATAEVAAYRQSQTCIPAGEEEEEAPSSAPLCDIGEQPNPMAWPRPEVEYVLFRDGFGDYADADGTVSEDFEAAVVESFETWNAGECSNFTFVYGGLTDTDSYNPSDETNVVTWREPWPYATDAYAVTSVTSTLDGEITDADMELNVAEYTFTNTDEQPAVVVDVRNTVTHESGHVLGLGHSTVEGATMEFDAPIGELQKRDLHRDDLEGLCAIYPDEQDPPDDPGPEDPKRGCCSVPGSASRAPAWAMAWLLVVVAVWRRRREEGRGHLR